MSIDHLLNRKVTIRRKTRAADGVGGHTASIADLATNVRARLRPASTSERERAQRFETRLTHVMYLRPNQDIRRSDQVVSGSQTLDVVAVRTPSVSTHHLEVDLTEEVGGV